MGYRRAKATNVLVNGSSQCEKKVTEIILGAEPLVRLGFFIGVLVAVGICEALVPRRGTSLRIDVPDSLPSIEGDSGQIRQLFTNLVSNAFEALDGRGTVTITAQYVPGDDGPGSDGLNAMPTVVVDVANDGPGIPDDLQDRIFNPFFTTKPRGSGLGLAIVRKIVDAHDGRISIIAPPSGGARFRVVAGAWSRRMPTMEIRRPPEVPPRRAHTRARRSKWQATFALDLLSRTKLRG